MASIIQIGNSWRAQVRRKGHKPVTKTFGSRVLAEMWANKLELELQARAAGIPLVEQIGTKGMLMSEILDQALEAKNTDRTKRNTLKHLRSGLGAISLDLLTSQDLIRYVERRGYGPATAHRELAVLRGVLRMAEIAWGYYVPDVFPRARAALKMMGKIRLPKSRDRRPTEEELEKICSYFDKHSSLPMRDIIWFAVWTAMRASEITRLRWSEYDRKHRTVVIRDRKDPKERLGNHQVVPLLDEAIEIIERQPRTSEFIFPYIAQTFSTRFPDACKECGIVDLRFHDLRHEGTSRLFERGYQIHEVALFTSHRDWKQLRRYTHLRARDLRRLPQEGSCPCPPSPPSIEAPQVFTAEATIDPRRMTTWEIELEIDAIHQRYRTILRLENQLQNQQMQDTDRCLALKDELDERSAPK